MTYRPHFETQDSVPLKADKPYSMVKILTRHCIYFLKDCFAQPIWGFGTGKSRVVQRKTLTISFRKLQLWVSRRENILKIVLNPRVNSQYKILVNHLGRKENKHHHQQQQQQQQETWHKIILKTRENCC